MRTAAGLLALTAVAALLGVRELDAGLWIDEGLSYGIADRPLLDIPGVMRQDGSPPLYYMLLHVWTAVTGGRSEATLHGLSLVFALLTVPVAFALARSLFGARAGWIAAALFATNPFVSQYAQEARMYALVMLLGTVVCGTFVGAFLLARGRRWTVAFALAMAALLYTHNWALFLGAGLALAWLLFSRDREGWVAAAIIAVLYAPWLPTLLFQAQHTGAPWANPPDFRDLYEAPRELLGLTGQYVLLVAAGYGWSRLTDTGPAKALAVAAVTAIALPWALSAIEPAWAIRYLAVAVAPLLLLAAAGLARARGVGLAALAVTALVWIATSPTEVKSNVRAVAKAVAPGLALGDLIVSTQPEQVPVLHYYLGPGYEWATLWGPVTDLGVTDWRDGEERLRRTTVERDLEPLLAATRPGQRVALITPDFAILGRWKAPWTELVRVRSQAWEDAMRRDPRFRVVTVEPPNPVARPNELQAIVSIRRR